MSDIFWGSLETELVIMIEKSSSVRLESWIQLFNYSIIQLFKFLTIQVKVGGDLEEWGGEAGKEKERIDEHVLNPHASLKLEGEGERGWRCEGREGGMGGG